MTDRVSLAREEVPGASVRIGYIEGGAMRIHSPREQWDNDASTGARMFWAGAEESFLLASIPGREPLIRGATLRAEALDETVRQALGRPGRLQGLGSDEDPVLVRALRAFHQGVWEGGEPLAWQGWLELAIVRLVGGRGALPEPREPQGVRRAREYLHTHLGESVSLDQLAVAAGLGKFQILRAFTRAVGCSPHAYLRTLRLTRALFLLRTGTPTAAIAARLGFADQSHFTRAFGAEFGVTPARFARGAPPISRVA